MWQKEKFWQTDKDSFASQKNQDDFNFRFMSDENVQIFEIEASGCKNN